MDIKERFLDYISFDTESSETSGTHPSSDKETAFAHKLAADLIAEGVANAYVDEHSYVYGRVDNGKAKTIGLIAHMDTAPTIQGGLKNAKLVVSYDGKDIKLDDRYTLSPAEFPALKDVVGEDLIVTDGEHLLGGDDKAGVVIIFEFLKNYLANRDKYNYNLSICFTPDEEIGEGPLFFSTVKMKADVAFTLDGGSIYEANSENFNAASAKVTIKGVGVHPGSAKDKMVNAALLGIEINDLLPKDMIPSKTENYEGFFHLCSIKGDVENCELEYILRDHDAGLLEAKKNMLIEAFKKVSQKYPRAEISLSIKDEYKNMREYFIKDPTALKMIDAAYLSAKEKLKYVPIRGGTDGATITYMGLPCPNLGVGDFYPHGRYEFISLTQMKKMVDILGELFKGDDLK
jgi:tripeptide aminopeptidase